MTQHQHPARPSQSNPFGTTAWWLLGIAILLPACAWLISPWLASANHGTPLIHAAFWSGVLACTAATICAIIACFQAQHALLPNTGALLLSLLPGAWFAWEALPENQHQKHVRSAESGDARAALMVYRNYASGTGTTRDLAQATKWLRQSAEKGHGWSCYFWARLHDPLYPADAVLQQERADMRLTPDMNVAAEFYQRGHAAGHAGSTAALLDFQKRLMEHADALNPLLRNEAPAQPAIPHDAAEALACYELAQTMGLPGAREPAEELRRLIPPQT